MRFFPSSAGNGRAMEISSYLRPLRPGQLDFSQAERSAFQKRVQVMR